MSESLSTTLYYVHDPMCSWCWGFRRCWDQLQADLPDTIDVVDVVGGLAPDSDEPMPEEMRQAIAGYWHDVIRRSGAEFNFDFWQNCQPRRSTYPACRAVLAARKQCAGPSMTDAIQRAYYLRAMNPSDNSTLVTLAQEIGLDQGRFAEDLTSEQIEADLQAEFSLRRNLGVYSFPSLVLARGKSLTPIEIDYRDHLPALQIIRAKLESVAD